MLLPAPRPTINLTLSSGQLDTGQLRPLGWPNEGGAAIGAINYGVLGGHNMDEPRPTASIAKIILALSILHKKPLPSGQAGPTLTMTDDDVAAYNAEVARNGSAVPVTVGQQMSQYQALQALLLSSGNNIATTLTNWAFGSEQAYLTYANEMLTSMKLNKTQVADASGYSPQTVSTPRELVQLGIEIMKAPVLAEIVSQRQAMLPIIGAVSNTNQVLGISDINGIKTGFTDEAGGCLLFSATRHVAGSTITLVGVLQGLPDKSFAFVAAPEIVEAGLQNFTQATAVTADQVVGTMTVPWAPQATIVAQNDLHRTVWKGTKLYREVSAKATMEGDVGHVTLQDQSTNLLLRSNLPAPSPLWRLTHPFELLNGIF